MCATYDVQFDPFDLRLNYEKGFDVFLNWFGEFPVESPLRVVPYRAGPVITAIDQRCLALEMMQYSLIPSWSREKKLKFATYNARIETVCEKPTWKESFPYHHCLIPVSQFVEPIYTGDYAGNMVGFYSDNVMLAAGIYNRWLDRTTGDELASYAMLMKEPLAYVKKVGHDRSPIFLSLSDGLKWMRGSRANPQEQRKELLSMALTPELQVRVDRPLASGWQKRIPQDLEI